jgi:hypothetical protein
VALRHALLLVAVGALLGAGSAGAASRDFVVQPYYVVPGDQPSHPEYEAAVRDHIRQVRKWYREQIGASFHVAQLKVVQSPLGFVAMRCGPFPTFECIQDREQMPFWWGSMHDVVGGLEPRTAKWVFAQGGGGFAGANLVGDFSGFALAGDWVLEPIVEPEAITCAFSDGWQCAIDANGNGAPYGTGPHELGHAFGLHHPDGYDGMSLMKWHGDYPSTTLMPHEVMILRESPWFSNRAFDDGAPFVFYESTDVAHWGAEISLGGSGFADGDQVEFRDATHSVFVTPDVRSPSLLRVVVPFGLGPGYVRVWRGGLRSNVVPVNIYP